MDYCIEKSFSWIFNKVFFLLIWISCIKYLLLISLSIFSISIFSSNLNACRRGSKRSKKKENRTLQERKEEGFLDLRSLYHLIRRGEKRRENVRRGRGISLSLLASIQTPQVGIYHIYTKWGLTFDFYFWIFFYLSYWSFSTFAVSSVLSFWYKSKIFFILLIKIRLFDF